MDSRTELALYELAWGIGMVLSSPLRIETDSFEQWARRNRLSGRIAELESRELLEVEREADLERIIRLTKSGRLALLGGRDPQSEWTRPWDGLWRFLLYDVPTYRNELRLAIWRWARERNWGHLQGSVWVSPASVSDLRAELRNATVDTKSLLIVVGRPDGGESDEDFVAGAWNFSSINRRYGDYLAHLAIIRPGGSSTPSANWRRKEHELWLRAVTKDPLLPRALWPRGYLGPKAFFARMKLLPGLNSVA